MKLKGLVILNKNQALKYKGQLVMIDQDELFRWALERIKNINYDTTIKSFLTGQVIKHLFLNFYWCIDKMIEDIDLSTLNKEND